MWINPGEIPGNGIDDDGDGYVDDIHGIDTVNNDSDPMDDNGHGTHTAGTIGARGNNGIGVTGVAWNPQIIACKFLDSTGSGFDSGAIACFDYFVDLKLHHGINIRVTSNSWGAPRDLSQPFPTVMKAAIDAAGNAGIVNVFAAGNSNTNNDVTPFDPASFASSSLISVAASDSSDARASFSNYGPTSVHLAAPGVNILSTYQNGYAYASGTSMATPHVAGTVALMASANPSLTVNALKGRLLASVDPIPGWSGLTATAGRLNVYQAVARSFDNLPPSVSLTAPVAGVAGTAPATVTVSANASDADGSVAQVAFYAGLDVDRNGHDCPVQHYVEQRRRGQLLADCRRHRRLRRDDDVDGGADHNQSVGRRRVERQLRQDRYDDGRELDRRVRHRGLQHRGGHARAHGHHGDHDGPEHLYLAGADLGRSAPSRRPPAAAARPRPGTPRVSPSTSI